MRLILVVLLCLISAGCRSHPRKSRETALLRAEILDLEDKYYLLKSKYDNVIGQLEDGDIVSPTIIEGQTIYEDGVIYESMDSETAPIGSGVPLSTDMTSRPTRRASHGSIVAEPIRPGRGGYQSRLTLNPRPIDNSQDINLVMPERAESNSKITAISIEQNSTQGRDVDGNPGDEGVDVFVQLTTIDGDVEYQSGELTVSIIDPEETPERQRIGLWKFLPEESKLFFAEDDQGRRGILMHLPWDQSTPINEQLTLHVRFIGKDGRVLKTSDQIRITPPQSDYDPLDSRVVHWTRNDPRWIPEPISPTENPEGNRAGRLTSRSSVGDSGDRSRTRAMPSKTGNERPAWRPIR